MNKKKFEYFLNAVYYCIYKEGIWSGYLIEITVRKCFHVICRAFGWESKCYKRKSEFAKDTKSQYYELKTTHLLTGSAHYWFGQFYSNYPMLLSFVVIGFILREQGELNSLMLLIILAIPMGLGYIPAYKAVFSNDRYLKYFKKFEKEDEQWHRKWEKRTIAFCFVSIIVVLIGICLAFAIATSK